MLLITLNKGRQLFYPFSHTPTDTIIVIVYEYIVSTFKV